MRITKRLITERGFTGVAIEGDWPDAIASTASFRARRPTFYGLDLYSLGASMESVIAYLDHEDPPAATRARERYECLQPYAGESTDYGEAMLLKIGEPCRRRVIEQLVELRRRAGEYLLRDGVVAEDEYFFAEQNAMVVANAEEYYRTMFGDRAGSWNLRDRHMADTLDQLSAHLDRHGTTSRLVVWAHNSHVGDARATEMAGRGELNIGQLIRALTCSGGKRWVCPVPNSTDEPGRSLERTIGRSSGFTTE